MEFVPAGVANDLLRVDRWIPDLGPDPVHPAAQQQGHSQYWGRKRPTLKQMSHNVTY
jgi:hypothetical protein